MTTSAENPSAQQDESAVSAVRGGDAERYRELVERHERRVYAVAWSRLGDAALAEEVTQEAFIRAYRRLSLLGDGAKFAGWISTIARRVAINFGVRHRRELNKRERWALDNFDDVADANSENEAESIHSPETLRQTLAELPAAHRECLVLFYIDGKSGADAAAALGISEATLRVRLHRARAAMRERLEEKLETSLQKLRPAKTLVPAVMAGVLASSSAKAATAGATITGALAKIGITKWLLPFASFFSFLFLLPMLLVSWLFWRLELNNFRDPKGFRARLFRTGINRRIWVVLVGMILAVVIVPSLGKLVPLNLNLGGSLHPFFLLIAVVSFAFLPLAMRRLLINRNPFYVAQVGGSLLNAIACLLVGLKLLPISLISALCAVQALLTLPFYRHRPVRMDYSLFLRATENLLRAVAQEFSTMRRTKGELHSFASFLGSRWLVNNHRWVKNGMWLRLPQPSFSQWAGWTDLMFNFSWKHRSLIQLGWDGTVSAQLGDKDQEALQSFRGTDAIFKSELEALVAAAVATAWKSFRESDIPAAERALGHLPDAELFVISPAKGGIAKVRWLMATLMILCLVAFAGLRFPGCRAALARLDGLRPVNITEAQARAFLSLVSTNPNPLVKDTVGGREGWTRKSFTWDPSMALMTCMVLPETNLFPALALQAMQTEIVGANPPKNGNGSENYFLSTAMLVKRALVQGWLGWDDIKITPAEVAEHLRQNPKDNADQFEFEFLLSRARAWSWVDNKAWDVERTGEYTLNQLKWLRAVNCLDLVNREKLIAPIASVQTLSGTPPGQPPIHDWRDVRGLFFTPCFPVLQDTYYCLAALEILGGLGKIDREACIQGILPRHEGKGFFTSPDSGGFNEYHIDGSARDTIAAFESLRILGALDRLRDLDGWKFRPQRRGLAEGQLTWQDIEAWVCQQRLEKILHARKENPNAPFGSLLAP